jgi:hypothetical protein
MTAKPMTDDEIRGVTAASAGFRGWFAYVPDEVFEIERLAFIPDGYNERDVDHVVVISEDLEPHVIEPLATMLNAVPRLLGEVERLTQERDAAKLEADAAGVGLWRLDLEVKRSGEELARMAQEHEALVALTEARRQRINGMVRQLERFGHEADGLRAELDSIAPHTRDSETEPDAEVLAAPVRCDCYSVVIPAGDSAVIFTDETGRECWAHYGRCPGMLVPQVIDVATVNGPLSVSAHVSGMWAAHEALLSLHDPERWVVTHVPTGHAARFRDGTTLSRATALMLAEELGAHCSAEVFRDPTATVARKRTAEVARVVLSTMKEADRG